MRDQNQRGGGINWVQTYFAWKILFIVSRVLGALGAGLVIAGWFVVYEVAPQYGSQYLVVVIGLAALSIPVLIVVGIYRLFAKPKPLPEWVPQGAIANPPGDFFDNNGNRLWKRVGDRWERTTVLSHDL